MIIWQLINGIPNNAAGKPATEQERGFISAHTHTGHSGAASGCWRAGGSVWDQQGERCCVLHRNCAGLFWPVQFCTTSHYEWSLWCAGAASMPISILEKFLFLPEFLLSMLDLSGRGLRTRNISGRNMIMTIEFSCHIYQDPLIRTLGLVRYECFRNHTCVLS